jgi:hypothetical protein
MSVSANPKPICNHERYMIQRVAEVNLQPTEASKAGGALHNQDLPPRFFEMPTFHHG